MVFSVPELQVILRGWASLPAFDSNIATVKSVCKHLRDSESLDFLSQWEMSEDSRNGRPVDLYDLRYHPDVIAGLIRRLNVVISDAEWLRVLP